ncbi:MAG: hypothetical protein JNN18_04405 [Rubrivivax sp.]|nr:hypothetical protein [Rubrivivax sp.]
MNEDLSVLVDATLAGTHDFEDTWRKLKAAIEGTPGSRRLRRLRMALARAANLRDEYLEDLRALVQIDPRGLAALELGLQQFAWEGVGVDLDPAAAGRRLTRLLGLLNQLGSDAKRLTWALDVWDGSSVWEPWWRLQIALHAAALHPADPALQRHLALSWAQLVQHPPALESPDGRPPLGFTLDATGNLCDALVAGRALAALDEALAASPGDPELLNARALVHQGVSRFVAAEMDFAQAGRAWDRESDRTDLPPGEGARARSYADRAFALAQRCSGGRDTLSRPWLPDSGGGPHTPGTLFSMPTFPGIPTGKQTSGKSGSSAPGESSEQQQARLAMLARAVAEQLAPLLDPVAGRWREARRTPSDLSMPDGLPTDTAMDEAGLAALAWAEHPSLDDPSGGRVPCHVWASRDGTVTVVAVTLGADAFAVEASTEFTDGRYVITSNARGRTCMSGGATVDVLHTDPTLALERMLALHRGRLAALRARQPALKVRPVRSFADFADAQDRQRAAELAHRRACGLDEFEALAVPAELPEVFAPMLQGAALAWLKERYPAGG